MSKLILHPTDVSQWHSLVSEAEFDASLQLPEALESYLVFLLQRFADQAQWVGDTMAEDYLNSYHLVGHQRDWRLREVGDKCLLISGFFPGQASRRRVAISYYINLGRMAYQMLASRQEDQELFSNLSDGFKEVMLVMQSIRRKQVEAIMEPLQAFECACADNQGMLTHVDRETLEKYLQKQ